MNDSILTGRIIKSIPDIKFEIISNYKDKDINLPKRGTKYSAGYDIEAAETIIVPSIFKCIRNIITGYKPISPYMDSEVRYFEGNYESVKTMDEIKSMVKKHNLRTMVPTGLKVQMRETMYLELHPRSSTGSNCLLQLANQTGIIDADYYNNPDNEGHIFIALINLSPYDIKINKGDKIAQGIFREYLITDDDEAYGSRKGGFGSTDTIPNNNIDPHFGISVDDDIELDITTGAKLNTLPVGGSNLYDTENNTISNTFEPKE